MALTGGREGWIRTVLTAVGVGLGVVTLLAAAAVPAALDARTARGAARDLPTLTGIPDRGANTLLISEADTQFRDTPVRGRIVRPDGPHAPVPPGLSVLPGP